MQTNKKITAELLNLLYKNTGFSLVTSIFVAIVLSLQYWHSNESMWSLVWFSGMATIILFRYVTLKQFTQSREKYSDSVWKNIYYVSVFVSGCLWGASGLFYELGTDSIHWIFNLFVLGGITAGAISTLSPFSNAYILLAIPTFIPIIINIMKFDNEHNVEIGLLLVIYVIMTSLISRRANKFLIAVTKLRIKNEEMKEIAESNLDLVQQHQIELYEKEGYLQSILDTALEAILTMNKYGKIELVNPAVVKMFGYTENELIGENVSLLMPDSISSFHQNKVEEYLVTNKQTMTGRKIETTARRKDGSTFPVAISVSDNIINDEHVFTSVMSDISEEKQITDELKLKNTELKYLSSHDELTGIYNRRSVNEYLRREWDRAYRQKYNITLLMIDVDYFKKYNDHYGHLAGDDCLRYVSRALKTNLHRPGDFLGRYGGEEFIIILPETGLSGAIEVAKHLLSAVEELNIPHKQSTFEHVTVSIGIASTIPQKMNNHEKMISCSDAALYRAKEQGRNRVVTSSEKP